MIANEILTQLVSTHSRLKAAVSKYKNEIHNNQSFNTQPPEGGCAKIKRKRADEKVSTHSRLKAAVSPWCWRYD